MRSDFFRCFMRMSLKMCKRCFEMPRKSNLSQILDLRVCCILHEAEQARVTTISLSHMFISNLMVEKVSFTLASGHQLLHRLDLKMLMDKLVVLILSTSTLCQSSNYKLIDFKNWRE